MKELNLPLIPVRDVVIFPNAVVPISLKREKSILALEEALLDNKQVFLSMQKLSDVENPNPDEIFLIGTIATVNSVHRIPDGTINIVVHGENRAEVVKYSQMEPFYKVVLKVHEKENVELAGQSEALLKAVVEQFRQGLALGKTIPMDMLPFVFDTSDPLKTLDVIVFSLDLTTSEKQRLLESNSLLERLKIVSEFINHDLSVLSTARNIQDKTAEELGKSAKEAFLREQMRTIERELGIKEEQEEYAEIEQKIKNGGMPTDVAEKAMKELGRLKKMPPISPEVSFLRNYLDWLVDLPWKIVKEISVDITKAAHVLDNDHYGLKKAKTRILEYLAVQKLVGKVRGPILCFYGPPGVGKTSIGRSIAKSLERKFVKISLGGIRDEAELRGHRRTYVGALPGRIIQGMKSAGSKNPVFMLDEIDKVGNDFRGDPSAALLEALDPEQNFAFSDHYLEVAYDLSDVLFIATANSLETIPPALRDRMEIVEFPGYTEEEKLHIAKDYLVPKQLEAHGLKKTHLRFEDDAISSIITSYTREAGVRNLEREIASVDRKIAKAITEGKRIPDEITPRNLEKYLGPIRFRPWALEKKDEVGVSTGLAWTEAGGDVLSIESTLMNGKGNLILTGHLGDIMKESAQAALSYARAKADQLEVPQDFYKDKDVHIHVPAGAIPKDGPSAGITMATSLISSITGIPIRHEVGMTGEITLRGKVLEIGGIKEKVLAAHRAGLKTIIIPTNNQRDLQDIPVKTRKDLKFVYAENMDDVLKAALVHYPSFQYKSKPEIETPYSTLA
ncbi:MAG: endopeptidase La [Candidatus Woykebacteria bacterium RIFCSPHIGHO2_12_FULL_43_10]|uniref:Lon protease n=1 Tax=Candidatus Woykebacteria bacterium RIFCSPHIGHO2_02_FULL_43_16b TaxID=1802601 RepID=A0A1G1WL68_9BACT|nr:MAG: endopeptidase La [Candidatus Woykebacteria bacterium RIFCSPHIGHO2_02_FULL_43_16b]OGY28593.1 MAG: endopeptidase La [Candidatus Woykebacteria bacterium RIFCSPHIGHO2_12_FULL_43_10]